MLRSRELLLFLQRSVLQPLDIHAISRLTLARNNPGSTERSIPKKKLRVWGVQKWKHWVCAKRTQKLTASRITPIPVMARAAANGYSRKFTANPSPDQSLHYFKEHT